MQKNKAMQFFYIGETLHRAGTHSYKKTGDSGKAGCLHCFSLQEPTQWQHHNDKTNYCFLFYHIWQMCFDLYVYFCYHSHTLLSYKYYISTSPKHNFFDLSDKHKTSLNPFKKYFAQLWLYIYIKANIFTIIIHYFL